jgi:sugar/nucleoside kinase (ribokinase family)
MSAVLCLGELLVDWVCTTPGAELDSALGFTKAPGGAPANVAVGLARQGIKSAFLGRIGADGFGFWLKQVLESDDVDVSGLVVDADAQTRMAYVVTTSTGDRKLAEFSRVACADSRISPEDLSPEQFEKAKAFHFGSISLIAEPSAGATKKAVELAHKHDLLVSYDPNVRLGLWPSAQSCKQALLDSFKWTQAHIVKINLDELEFLTGSRDFQTAEKLRETYGIPLLIITLDRDGAHFLSSTGSKTIPGFQVELVEATGAGDGFVSGVLYGLLERSQETKNPSKLLQELTLDDLSAIITRANAIGALTCTKAGAIPGLPDASEIASFLEKNLEKNMTAVCTPA